MPLPVLNSSFWFLVASEICCFGHGSWSQNLTLPHSHTAHLSPLRARLSIGTERASGPRDHLWRRCTCTRLRQCAGDWSGHAPQPVCPGTPAKEQTPVSFLPVVSLNVSQCLSFVALFSIFSRFLFRHCLFLLRPKHKAARNDLVTRLIESPFPFLSFTTKRHSRTR